MASNVNNQGALPGHLFYIRLIFLKEIREIFRDKRTRFSVIISPLLVTPVHRPVLEAGFLLALANRFRHKM